jgi:hypothetical protein
VIESTEDEYLKVITSQLFNSQFLQHGGRSSLPMRGGVHWLKNRPQKIVPYITSLNWMDCAE